MSNRFGLEDLYVCDFCGIETSYIGNGACLMCLGELAMPEEGDADTLLEAEPLTYNGRDW